MAIFPITPTSTRPHHHNFCIFRCLSYRCSELTYIEASYLVYRLIVASPSLRHQNVQKRAWLCHVTRLNFGYPIHMSRMAEARAVKFLRGLYQVLPKGCRITHKRGVVWLTWPIFACATVDLTEINNVVDDRPLSHLWRCRYTKAQLKLHRFDFLCIGCKLASIIRRQNIH